MQSTHLQAANLGAGHELFVESFLDAVDCKDETVINTQCINLLNYTWPNINAENSVCVQRNRIFSVVWLDFTESFLCPLAMIRHSKSEFF